MSNLENVIVMGTNSDSQLLKVTPIELDTLTINSQVTSKFCISWSQDDKVSIIIDSGVFVFVSCTKYIEKISEV